VARKNTALADLDIAAEGLSQQDGLAERIMRSRVAKIEPPQITPNAVPPIEAMSATPAPTRAKAVKRDNSWRKDKALIQVAVSSDSHIELAILAKRRRIPLSDLVREAVNDWLAARGHTLRITE
jgi:hypothetical protein